MFARTFTGTLVTALLLSACGKDSASARKDSKVDAKSTAPAATVTSLRFSGIPDADKQKLTQQYAAVATWLSAKLGMPVEYVHAPDYNGAVTSLAANKIDMAWLGGVTAVEAEQVTKGQTIYIAARDTDLKFKSYFVANRSRIEDGRFQEVADRNSQPLSNLAAMKPAFKLSTFTFGAKGSTSGHVMPRHFLELPEVGIDPEKDFAAPAGYQLQGGHSATLAAVASGAFDTGVLNYTSWEQATAELKAQAPVIYVTPEYVDYCMVGHQRLGTELCNKLRDAFTSLDASNAADKAVLDAFGASRFVAADPKSWDGIRSVLASAKARGVLD
jgi:phosphonate transport system substrate-binding protein